MAAETTPDPTLLEGAVPVAAREGQAPLLVLGRLRFVIAVERLQQLPVPILQRLELLLRLALGSLLGVAPLEPQLIQLILELLHRIAAIGRDVLHHVEPRFEIAQDQIRPLMGE